MTNLSDSTVTQRLVEDQWISVCSLEDLPLDAGVAALLGEDTTDEIQIALFRPSASDVVYALGNFDPFSQANVLGRGILCSIGDQLAVASPLGKQHFSLHNGCCFEDENICVGTYPVEIRNGAVFVQVQLAGGA